MLVLTAAGSIIVLLMQFSYEPMAVSNADKIFFEATGIQETDEPYLYGYHIVGMLNNLDDIEQEVQLIKINDSDLIKIDVSFKANLEENIKHLVRTTNLDEFFFRRIEKMEVKEIPGSGVPYIHYTMAEEE